MQPLKAEVYKEVATSDSVQEIVIGSLESTTEGGTCQVSFWYRGAHYTRAAVIMGTLPAVALHHPVALGFANADLGSPIVLGPVHVNLQSLMYAQSGQRTSADPVPASRVLDAAEEIELRCGEASIRLTRSGKILINGEYVLSCSRGVNRIVGASVEVN